MRFLGRHAVIHSVLKKEDGFDSHRDSGTLSILTVGRGPSHHRLLRFSSRKQSNYYISPPLLSRERLEYSLRIRDKK